MMEIGFLNNLFTAVSTGGNFSLLLMFLKLHFKCVSGLTEVNTGQ